jgi:hypothetical protein
MKEILVRMVLGGSLVSAFAALGDVFKPKRFAGLFGLKDRYRNYSQDIYKASNY